MFCLFRDFSYTIPLENLNDTKIIDFIYVFFFANKVSTISMGKRMTVTWAMGLANKTIKKLVIVANV